MMWLDTCASFHNSDAPLVMKHQIEAVAIHLIILCFIHLPCRAQIQDLKTRALGLENSYGEVPFLLQSS